MYFASINKLFDKTVIEQLKSKVASAEEGDIVSFG
jgi:hypothetical protein